MALRTRLSPPFGRQSPAFREDEPLQDLIKLMDERVTQRYETGFAVQTRDCSGRIRVEMLDGRGGAALGLSNACDEGVAVGAGGVAEIFWGERSDGRTVRTLYDLGVRAGRVQFESLTFPAEREMPVAAVDLAWVAVGTGTYVVARSVDNGETWAGVTSTEVPTTPLCVAYGAGVHVIGGYGGRQLAYSSDGGETWTDAGSPLAGGEVYDILWTGTQFVAVGYSDNFGSAALSPDGITWTAINPANVTGTWNVWSRVATWGTSLVASVWGRNNRIVTMVSTDNGTTWQGHVSSADDVLDDGVWMDLSTSVPASITASGTTVLIHGYGLADAGVFAADTLDPAIALADASMGNLALLYYNGAYAPNDRVRHAASVITASYSSTAIRDLYWDGAQFIALGVGELGWVAVSNTGTSWTNYLDSVDMGGLTAVRKIRHSGTRYLVGGILAGADMPLVWANNLSGWTLATAAEPLMTSVFDMAKGD